MSKSVTKALSIRAPWWWWILYGGKNIENRSWTTDYRGPLLIHASTYWNAGYGFEADHTALDMHLATLTRREQFTSKMETMLCSKARVERMRELRGHVVGICDIVDMVPPERVGENPWHMHGQWGWKLENARPVTPFKVKGMLGLFNVEFQNEN